MKKKRILSNQYQEEYKVLQLTKNHLRQHIHNKMEATLIVNLTPNKLNNKQLKIKNLFLQTNLLALPLIPFYKILLKRKTLILNLMEVLLFQLRQEILSFYLPVLKINP